MIKDILELAREAGLLSEDEAWVSLHQEAMERFAELLEAKVRADERKVLEQALEALEVLTDNYDDNAVGIEIDAIIALRKRLARPDPLQRLTDVQQEIEAALAPEQKPVDIGTEWTSCVKLPVTVHVRQQRPGETHVSTREGITPVKPDDLIMRGVSGEEYPIGREIFERTYQLGEAQTKPEQEPQPRRIALDSEALYLRAKQRAEKEAALSCPEGNKRKRLQEELTDRYFYEYTTGLSTGRR